MIEMCFASSISKEDAGVREESLVSALELMSLHPIEHSQTLITHFIEMTISEQEGQTEKQNKTNKHRIDVNASD